MEIQKDLNNNDIIETQENVNEKRNDDSQLKLLLSFAIGAILGDVFFHLIPESIQSHLKDFNYTVHEAHKQVGISVIAGLFLFIIVEMLMEKWSQTKEDGSSSDNTNSIDSAGYLNLIANGFDNFTHGLAIGASFLVSLKVGLLTTFVIFIHEIPHEICDYAILVNSGFSRWDAVKAQSSVSLFGMLGTTFSLYIKSVKALNKSTAWILPFSAGGFLYIALVSLLPEILAQQGNTQDSIRQTGCVLIGIAFMAFLAVI